jgi:hypothetical protein
MKVLMSAACFIEGGEDEGSNDDLVVWVSARYRASALMKVLMSAACCIEGGVVEGSGRLGAGVVSTFSVEGSEF